MSEDEKLAQLYRAILLNRLDVAKSNRAELAARVGVPVTTIDKWASRGIPGAAADFLRLLDELGVGLGPIEPRTIGESPLKANSTESCAVFAADVFAIGKTPRPAVIDTLREHADGLASARAEAEAAQAEAADHADSLKAIRQNALRTGNKSVAMPTGSARRIEQALEQSLHDGCRRRGPLPQSGHNSDSD